jgi:cold shock CspA family protein
VLGIVEEHHSEWLQRAHARMCLRVVGAAPTSIPRTPWGVRDAGCVQPGGNLLTAVTSLQCHAQPCPCPCHPCGRGRTRKNDTYHSPARLLERLCSKLRIERGRRSRSRSPPRRGDDRNGGGGGGGGGRGQRLKGETARWNPRGFGFIKPMDGGGEDIFCHVSVITDGNVLREGDMVEYEQEYDDRKGKYRAIEVTGGRREEERSDDRRGGGGGCEPPP